jgi:hydroxymethylglutaryl-CoA synthase
MSEPITRRKIIVDYRINATKCKDCGMIYFPPKLFCYNEGRDSRMEELDFFYKKGVMYSGAVINTPSNKFKDLGAHISGIFEFPDHGFRVPGRITDFIPPNESVDFSSHIGREVVPRFRRNYSGSEDGLVHYSSLNFSFTDGYYPHQEYVKIDPSKEVERPGIVGYGVYLPKYRIKNEGGGVLGVTERTLPFGDEDTTTFSVEAGKRALIHAALDSTYVTKCFVGTESPTYAVKPIMATVVQALELGDEFEDGYFSGGIDSQFACKAATDLFIDAAALVNYPNFGGEHVMVIGSDNSQASPGDPLDYTVGAGAAAFIFGRRDVIATLDHYLAYTSDTPDFYRREGEKYPRHGGRFTGTPAYYKHVLTATKAILKKSGLKHEDINYVIFHGPNASFPQRAAQQAGFTREQVATAASTIAKIGNLYSGSCPASLGAVLDISEPGDKILMTAYGSGAGSDSYVFTVTDKIVEKRERLVPVQDQIESPHKEYVDYVFYRKMKDIA